MRKCLLLAALPAFLLVSGIGIPTAAQSQYYGDDNGDDTLTLICWGEGRKLGTQYRNGYEWDPRRDRYEYRGRLEYGTQEFDSEVQIEFYGGRAGSKLTASKNSAASATPVNGEMRETGFDIGS